tara:strand:- start:183 stop:326 length:144 start_codon:yes stop_codon:yes gene_type:complete
VRITADPAVSPAVSPTVSLAVSLSFFKKINCKNNFVKKLQKSFKKIK